MSTHITIAKFDSSNYNRWSGQVELHLEQKPVLGIISETIKKPTGLASNATATDLGI
jgi:hypothetical protein